MLVSAQNKNKEIAFFDQHAEAGAYDAFTPASNRRLIECFARLSGLRGGARIADLGCGSGAFTEQLRRAGYSVIGLDISRKLVAVGRSKHPGLELIEGDVEALPFELRGVRRRSAQRIGAPPAGSASLRGGDVSRAPHRRTFRCVRSEPYEPVHVAISRPLVAILQRSWGDRERAAGFGRPDRRGIQGGGLYGRHGVSIWSFVPLCRVEVGARFVADL